MKHRVDITMHHLRVLHKAPRFDTPDFDAEVASVKMMRAAAKAREGAAALREQIEVFNKMSDHLLLAGGRRIEATIKGLGDKII